MSAARLSALAFAAATAVAGPAAAQERIKLAVLDFRGQGVGAELVANASSVVTAALGELGVFDVLSRADIQQMLQFEQQKQLVGCESDASCLADIGGALGVALLVDGSIGLIGNNYLVNLALTDTQAAVVLAREQRQVASLDQLPAELQGAARFLVRGLLQGRQGTLVLTGSETGAEVEIDGKLAGVTPLARQELAGGPHRVVVIKKGFITWGRDISIDKDQATVLEVSLVPSLEYIEAYEARAAVWRIAGLVTGGAGVAALGAGIGMWIFNDIRVQRFNRDVLAANCQEGAEDEADAAAPDCGAYEDQRRGIDAMTIGSRVLAGVGLAAVGTGIFLLLAGPDRGVYDAYKPAVSAALVPLADGVLATLAGPF